MKIAHFDCFCGISGDMALGAFIDAGLSTKTLRAELAKLKVIGYSISARKVKRCGISATKLTVKVDDSTNKKRRRYSDIVKLITASKLSGPVKERALDIFKTVATVEAKVHAVNVEDVHFHEVGAVDSIVDIVGAAIAIHELGIDKITASPVNTGSGVVKTSHGILPVPAPATALLLNNIPSYAEGPNLELTTPTGAAILKTLGSRFGPQPMMITENVGCGAGGHDFDDRPNILRIFIGTDGPDIQRQRLTELKTNIDDMNPQAYDVVTKLLFDAGALDVTLTPVQMKKGRPGTMLTTLCQPGKADGLERILFVHTSTLGVRRYELDRVSLDRKIVKVKTGYGTIDVKVAKLPDGSVRNMPEYESVQKAARKHDKPFEQVYRSAITAADKRKL